MTNRDAFIARWAHVDPACETSEFVSSVDQLVRESIAEDRHNRSVVALTVQDASEEGAGWTLNLLDFHGCFVAHLATNCTYEGAIFELDRLTAYFKERGLRVKHIQDPGGL